MLAVAIRGQNLPLFLIFKASLEGLLKEVFKACFLMSFLGAIRRKTGCTSALSRYKLKYLETMLGFE